MGDSLDCLLAPTSNPEELKHQLHFLFRQVCDSNKDLSLIMQEHESISLQYQKIMNMNSQLKLLQNQGQNNHQNNVLGKDLYEEKDTADKIFNKKVAYVRQHLLAFTKKLTETLPLVENMHTQVLLDELLHWKREQQLRGNGVKLIADLNKIQEWCESLTEIIWLYRQQTNQAEILLKKLGCDAPEILDVLPNLQRKSTQLLSSLITSTFVIEKQPQQVIKTNTRITSTVRLLVGAKLNIRAKPPKVSVTIISETQARALLKNKKKYGNESAGDIPDNTGVMEYDESTGNLSVYFRNLRLKKIRRAEKKASESVTDEKFSLLFQSQFAVGDGELVFQVWTLSLPVVVVVHGSQDPHAWATVTWDNAFAKPGRIPFTVPNLMTWNQVADTLRVKFMDVTGCTLTDENLEFLAEKAFGIPALDYTSMVISFSQLCKEHLPLRTFTFWEWFYNVMKLTREHLRELWLEGHILGFVRKRDAEEMLSTCPKGTFLLRFSDSELGGITIAWVGDQNQVFMLQPFTSKDFAVRSLSDRISDLQQLAYLYFQIPKDMAFGKYYTPFDGNLPVNGYVKPLLVTHVPGINGVGPLNHCNTQQQYTYTLNNSLLQDSSSTSSTNESFNRQVEEFCST